MPDFRRKIATSVRWTPTLLDELKAAAAAAGLPMSVCLHLAVRCWLDGRQRGARLDEVGRARRIDHRLRRDGGAMNWRDLPPTAGQERVLRRWGMSAKTRSEASDMITAGVERAKAREKAFADAGVDDDHGWGDMPPPRDWGDL